MGHHLRAISRLCILLCVWLAAALLAHGAWRAWRENDAKRSTMAQSQAVYDEKLKELSAHIAAANGDAVVASTIRLGELTVQTTATHLLALMKFLHDDPKCLFRQLVDVCGADYPERPQRFDVVVDEGRTPLAPQMPAA